MAIQREHRRAMRVKVEAFVKVGGGEQEYIFRTRDLSVGGLFLFTRVAHIYPFQVGSTLDLELYDRASDGYVGGRGVIVRVVEPNSAEAERYPTGFGVRITEIDEDNKGRLERMISALAQ